MIGSFDGQQPSGHKRIKRKTHVPGDPSFAQIPTFRASFLEAQLQMIFCAQKWDQGLVRVAPRSTRIYLQFQNTQETIGFQATFLHLSWKKKEISHKSWLRLPRNSQTPSLKEGHRSKQLSVRL